MMGLVLGGGIAWFGIFQVFKPGLTDVAVFGALRSFVLGVKGSRLRSDVRV